MLVDLLVVSGGTGAVEAAESELRKLTAKPKLVMLPGPAADKDVKDCYSKVSTPQACVSVVDPSFGSAESKIVNDFGGVYVDPRRWYCVDDRCPAFVGRTPVKLDRYHLTTDDNALITPVVRETLEQREVITL